MACFGVSVAAVRPGQTRPLCPVFDTQVAWAALQRTRALSDLAALEQILTDLFALAERTLVDGGRLVFLLPTTEVLFTQRDSRRDGATAFFEARELATSAFKGQGCDAIVGAASSGPSALAALALKESSTPQAWLCRASRWP